MRFALVLCLMCFFSCVNDHTDMVVDTNPRLWSRGELKQIEFNISDTTALYDIDLFVRMDERCTKDTLAFGVEISKDENYSVNFVDYVFDLDSAVVSYPSQKMRSCRFKFLEGIEFSSGGDYIIKFKPQNDINGVWALGITIEENGKR